MRLLSVSAALALLFASALALDKPLDIKVSKKVECTTKSKKGDKVEIHYQGRLSDGMQPPMAFSRGTLQLTAHIGKEFDASYKRGTPLDFNIGSGQVIRGWEEGLLDMCVGEKRRLTIQPEWGYGARGMGPIPANSVLVFDTEMISINGKKEEPKAQDL